MKARRPASVFETKIVSLPRSMSRHDVRQLLTEEAEYGKWELARLRLYSGGERRIWLRRRVMRVHSTIDQYPPMF